MPPTPSSCFKICAAGRPPPPPPATGPIISTSIYETPLGSASLTWSRTLLGLSLAASVHLTPSPSPSPPLRFKIQPRLFFNLKGTRRIRFHSPPRTIHIAWNLTRAKFPSAASPEPSSGFFIALSVDGEIALLAGDMCDEAQQKMKAMQRSQTILVSRREHAVLKGGGGRRMGSYRSAVRIGGADREIGIQIDGGMLVTVDGKKVLHVQRLRWKFRGSERVDCGGNKILISWDLHTWFFPVRENASPASAGVFVFCFESEEVMGIADGSEREWGSRNGNWSESGSCGGGIERWKGRKNGLLKENSFSSSFSSAASSSAASSSVMEWGSSEEAEMRGVEGFTLVVYAWKN